MGFPEMIVSEPYRDITVNFNPFDD
ncbi:short chain dehydrogenase [Reinekea sp. MED297]|uniref:Short chain dehydrogenase n=1 Tax=Reinekea blandensis MED297 TaxID=314283 RepID=A4BGV4_9GAMM|nr:short chain dehydrogenase [Reinekea sp. MED297] [Reinekea blandensis MED297]